jgi:OmpA-OmpF porin, OOP family
MRVFVILVFLFIVRNLHAQLASDQSFQLVNSMYDELNPVITPDGKTLFFTIGNRPENTAGKKDPGDIWFSRWMDNQWSAPVHAGALLNDRSYNAVAGFSADGTHMYLLGHYSTDGTIAKSQGLSVSVHTGMGWSKPENISIPYFQNKSGVLGGSMSADNSVFVFSAETYGTRGVDDLYVSINLNGSWSEPKNLGSGINTQFQELSPSLSADGKTLYFSSNGRKGNGSFDVYYSTRLDDTWTNWSVPVNMGSNVNSEGRELYYRAYPDLGFALYTSTKRSDGYGDIKSFRPEQPLAKRDSTSKNKVDTVVRMVEVNREKLNDSDKVVKVYGKVTNSKTGEPVTAKIAFVGPGLNNQTTTSSSNGFSIFVPSTDLYTIKIEAAGYVSTMEKLDIHTYEMRELEMNFHLQPVEVGATVNLKNVLFVQTRTDLLPESFDELDLVVSFLKANPQVKIELAGHTDNRGVHADNVKLSQQRVNRVKEYLVSKGIDSKRITGKGYGGTKPIASNDSEETRKMNRRVEFVIKKS